MQPKSARVPRLDGVLLVTAFLLIAGVSIRGQEMWSLPATVAVTVDGSRSTMPIEGLEVTLRTFAGPLASADRRRAAFGPPIRSEWTNSYGWVWLKLPLWSMVIDRPLAVVCQGHGDMIYPFNRESFRPRVRPDPEEAVRFVDSEGRPLSGLRVALLIGVHHPSCVREGTWGPRYENLVVAKVATTGADGSAAVPPGAVVALVDRVSDIIPVILDGKRIVVPETFEAARLDERLGTALKESERAPPEDSAAERAVDERFSGKGTAEGKVILGSNCKEDAEIVVVPQNARLDIVASHRISTTRPKLPFTQTTRGHDHRFKIAFLQPGTYRLQVAAPHFAPKLTRPFEIRGDRTVRLEPVELERGAIVLVKGTWGYASFGGCTKCFDGPNGVIDGLAKGMLTISSWNGGCCVGPSKDVHVPRSGEVIVDLSDSQR